MEKPTFVQKITVDYSMVDRNCRLKLSSLLRFMQNAATMHYEVLGLGRMKLIKEGVVFLLSKIAMKVERVPKAEEELTLTTWEYGLKGAYFVRNFFFTSGEELCIRAQTLWVAVDPNDHHIIRPADFPYPINVNDTEAGIDAGRVSERGAEAVATMKRKVRYSDLDCNGHMNNCVYADLCTDILFENVEDTPINGFSINFNRECRMGEELELTLFKGEDGYIVSGDFADGKNSFKAKIL